jgi:hypothetical protein
MFPSCKLHLLTVLQMVSYLAYIMRWIGEQLDYAESLIVTALRILQDCPANGIPLRKVSYNMFLVSYSYRTERL